MAVENPTTIKVNPDDALTLAYALDIAWRVIHGQFHLDDVRESGFAVRMRMKGAGDADLEQEYERLMNLLGYDA